MSDAAPAFWNSYRKYFNVSLTIRLLCIWHVWRAWTTNLQKLISDQQRRKQARAALQILAQ